MIWEPDTPDEPRHDELTWAQFWPRLVVVVVVIAGLLALVRWL